jgi:hypothetical protein
MRHCSCASVSFRIGRHSDAIESDRIAKMFSWDKLLQRRIIKLRRNSSKKHLEIMISASLGESQPLLNEDQVCKMLSSFFRSNTGWMRPCWTQPRHGRAIWFDHPQTSAQGRIYRRVPMMSWRLEDTRRIRERIL